MPTYAMLTIAKDTWLTLSKSPSTELPDDQKHHVSAGEMFILSSYERDAGFFVVTLSGLTPVDGHSTWFVTASDVRIEEEEDSVLDAQSVGSDTTIEPKPKPKP
ncbi:hypothetical protein [Phormidesmis priestleyi]|uniref:hypothetical protein n=1 Tax=Phormidesmis priestleyi TaxID=268141 RepID=UPI0012E75300|nr:hypothetical protein [Phormidesmis priestleyi]